MNKRPPLLTNVRAATVPVALVAVSLDAAGNVGLTFTADPSAPMPTLLVRRAEYERIVADVAHMDGALAAQKANVN